MQPKVWLTITSVEVFKKWFCQKRPEMSRRVANQNLEINESLRKGWNYLGVFDNVTREHLVKSIVEHLYCSGLSHVAHELELESGFETKNKDIKDKFLFLSELLTDLRNNKHQKVLDWIDENRQKLGDKNSNIEWKVRRMEFCQLLVSDGPSIKGTASLDWIVRFI